MFWGHIRDCVGSIRAQAYGRRVEGRWLEKKKRKSEEERVRESKRERKRE